MLRWGQTAAAGTGCSCVGGRLGGQGWGTGVCVWGGTGLRERTPHVITAGPHRGIRGCHVQGLCVGGGTMDTQCCPGWLAVCWLRVLCAVLEPRPQRPAAHASGTLPASQDTTRQGGPGASRGCLEQQQQLGPRVEAQLCACCCCVWVCCLRLLLLPVSVSVSVVVRSTV